MGYHMTVHYMKRKNSISTWKLYIVKIIKNFFPTIIAPMSSACVIAIYLFYITCKMQLQLTCFLRCFGKYCRCKIILILFDFFLVPLYLRFQAYSCLSVLVIDITQHYTFQALLKCCMRLPKHCKISLKHFILYSFHAQGHLAYLGISWGIVLSPISN